MESESKGETEITSMEEELEKMVRRLRAIEILSLTRRRYVHTRKLKINFSIGKGLTESRTSRIGSSRRMSSLHCKDQMLLITPHSTCPITTNVEILIRKNRFLTDLQLEKSLSLMISNFMNTKSKKTPRTRTSLQMAIIHNNQRLQERPQLMRTSFSKDSQDRDLQCKVFIT